ncbi:hypothetical protein [Lacimicrobium sp. SS2-24]|uniref:hypothetical protein n=1 Tax=Lacimicrobium sp. SS2-24 TaxID=2005569 RepID=UPI001131B9C0|nr:hypothetical protein [Lacimicrobium sp. SS2-24]
MSSLQLNQHIAELAAQLPQQRHQLVKQTRTLGASLQRQLSSPASLLLAACSGAALGSYLFGHHKDASGNLIRKRLYAVGARLRRQLWQGFMAYWLRTTV